MTNGSHNNAQLPWQPLLEFWFETLSPNQWWVGSKDLDRAVEKRFKSVHLQAIRGELSSWRESPHGALAEVMLLDQIPRHLYRGSSRAYAYDGMSLVLSQEAIKAGYAAHLTAPMRQFLYMPWMHSESEKIQEQGIELYKDPEMQGLRSAREHHAVIAQFGRFPHRNAILGRENTPDEVDYLKINPKPF